MLDGQIIQPLRRLGGLKRRDGELQSCSWSSQVANVLREVVRSLARSLVVSAALGRTIDRAGPLWRTTPRVRRRSPRSRRCAIDELVFRAQLAKATVIEVLTPRAARGKSAAARGVARAS